MEAEWSVNLLSRKFAEGGSEIIAIFHRETPVIAAAPLPNTTIVPSDAKLL